MPSKEHESNGGNPERRNTTDRKRERLELLLDCRRLELAFCKPGSGMHAEIQRNIAYLEKRLSALPPARS